jgi:hypothetical protein
MNPVFFMSRCALGVKNFSCLSRREVKTAWILKLSYKIQSRCEFSFTLMQYLDTQILVTSFNI